jgi:hypothetical protein
MISFDGRLANVRGRAIALKLKVFGSPSLLLEPHCDEDGDWRKLPASSVGNIFENLHEPLANLPLFLEEAETIDSHWGISTLR